MKKILFYLLALVLFLANANTAYAAPSSSVRLVKKQNVVISFSDIKSLKSISYELRYLNNGKEEGVAGTIRPKRANESRTIYLGTCSKRACTPHRNISNASVVVKMRSGDGSIKTKRYRLKF